MNSSLCIVRSFFCLLLLAVAAPETARSAPPPQTHDWLVGAAVAKITPTEPSLMAGYAGRTKPSEGVALELYAKALAIKPVEGETVVIVTCDLIGIPRGLREAVVAEVKTKHGLEPHQLLLNASHTHCGPQFRVTKDKPSADESDNARRARLLGERYVTTFVELVGQALADCRPAKLEFCRARCGFAMNRRTPTEKGYQNNPWSDGPVDHEVPVLKVSNFDDGKLKAVLFGYACHNTTIGFLQFCGDYAGYAQQHLEQKFPGATAHFLMGCGGDQNPYPRGELELARHHGRTLGIAVEAALGSKPQLQVVGRSRGALETATLEFAPPPPEEKLKLLAQTSGQEGKHAQRLLDQLAEDGKIETTYDVPVQAVKLGNLLTIVALPGESVVDYALRTKREHAAPGKHVWVAAYSNDVFGYIPSKRVLEEGGYEAGGAMLYSRFPGPFAVDVEERLMKAVKSVVDKVRAQ
jgi:neutral ceramidase